MIDYRRLKRELRDDPNGLGYAPVNDSADNDNRIAALMNEVAIPDKRPYITPEELWELMGYRDIKLVLSAAPEVAALFQIMMRFTNISLKRNGAAFGLFDELFHPAISDLQARLDQWRDYRVSRSSQLFGMDVDPSDIAIARRT